MTARTHWIADYWVLVGPDGLCLGAQCQPLLYRTRREARAAWREAHEAVHERGGRGRVRVTRVEAHLWAVRRQPLRRHVVTGPGRPEPGAPAC